MSRISTLVCGKLLWRNVDSVLTTMRASPLLTTGLPTNNLHLLSTRHFSVSATLDRLSAWEKKKVKGRKPRSLGRAVTKLELVDPDPTLDEEEEKLLAEWKKQYEVDMTHCYDLMKEKAILESLDTGAEKRWIQEERKHHANMMKENEEWNREIAAIRERDFAEAHKLEEAEIRAAVAVSMEAQAARQTEVMAYVNRLQEDSSNYVTLENLDAKVEEALSAALIDYDFALDRNGNKIKDRKNSAILSRMEA